MAVHHFNGFNDDYVKVYENATNPNKLLDMHSGTFKVRFKEVASLQHFEKWHDLAKLFMNALSDAINDMYNAHKRFAREQHEIQCRRTSVRRTSVLVQHTTRAHCRNRHQQSLRWFQMQATKFLINFWRIIIMILFGFLLVAVVWCVSLIMGINERIRDPLNAISLLFGVAPLHVLVTLWRRSCLSL